MTIFSLNVYDTIFFDVDQWIDNTLANAAELGITNTTEPCLDLDGSIPSICSNPDNYGFWDKIHPTAKAHQILGDDVAELIKNNQTVPEPLTILGAGTAIGFGGLFKRKLAKAGRNK